MTFEFILTSFLIVASPGTGAIYTVAAGLRGGRRKSIIAAFGCTLGVLPHMLAAISGLAALLHTSLLAFQILKYLGVCYLLYMAWAMFRDPTLLSASGAGENRSAGQVILSAVLVNLLNPKLSLFFFAFLPQFIAPNDPSPIFTMLALSAVFMAVTFFIFAIYGAFASAFRKRILSSRLAQVWMRRSFAAAFAMLAGKLALAQR